VLSLTFFLWVRVFVEQRPPIKAFEIWLGQRHLCGRQASGSLFGQSGTDNMSWQPLGTDCIGDFDCVGMRVIYARRFHSCTGFGLNSSPVFLFPFIQHAFWKPRRCSTEKDTASGNPYLPEGLTLHTLKKRVQNKYNLQKYRGNKYTIRKPCYNYTF